MSNANRDDNRVTTMLGTSSSDGSTPVPVYADPVTQRLKVDAAISSNSTSGIFTKKIDEASSTVTYIGEADPGTGTDEASWSIKRVSVSGSVTSIEWADGNTNYDNIWDNRASLSYS